MRERECVSVGFLSLLLIFFLMSKVGVWYDSKLVGC